MALVTSPELLSAAECGHRQPPYPPTMQARWSGLAWSYSRTPRQSAGSAIRPVLLACLHGFRAPTLVAPALPPNVLTGAPLSFNSIRQQPRNWLWQSQQGSAVMLNPEDHAQSWGVGCGRRFPL